MIKGILIINNYGKPRLCKFYESVTSEVEQQNVIRRLYQQVIKRSDSFCNYLEVQHLSLSDCIAHKAPREAFPSGVRPLRSYTGTTPPSTSSSRWISRSPI